MVSVILDNLAAGESFSKDADSQVVVLESEPIQ